MAERPPVLEVRVRVPRPPFTVDVAFDVPPGITVLSGPSGAGKSTTLQAIAGLEEPKGGRVALAEEAWFDGTTRVPIHARRVGYVFQSLALFPHMTARDNVAYGIPKGPSLKERTAHADAMLSRMKVGHLGDRKPRSLSGGEAQRVALARAFAMSPRVVLLDEPCSALDRALRREILLEIRAFAEELAVPFLLVTHHRDDARLVADRLVLLDEGRVSAVGTVEELWPARA